MKKSVAIINDELGTMSLGFSRAGYDISGIYVDFLDKNNSRVCKANWGDIVKDVNSEAVIDQDMPVLSNVECIAGKLYFRQFFVAGKREEENPVVSKIEHIIKEAQPMCFMVQCNRIDEKCLPYVQFCESLVELGYVIRSERIDTRFITGFPVKERVNFIIGTLHSSDINLEVLKNVDSFNHPLEKFLEKNMLDAERYCVTSPRQLQYVKRESENCVLCWNGKYYIEEELLRWNYGRAPLIAQGDIIRKITHREIARLKGIPDEYLLSGNNKYELYKKLMRCSNVQLIQQIASTINYKVEEKPYLIREASKALQFERVIVSYFEQKGVKNTIKTTNINTSIDYQYKTGNVTYNFIFKMYHNNLEVRNKVIAISKKLSERKGLDKTTYVLVVGNIVGDDTKKYIAENYNVIIWDSENLLWMLEEFPQLKSNLISILSFNVSDIVPKKNEPEIIERDPDNIVQVDLQEQLRRIKPGTDDFGKYEKLCTDIMKFLFSDNIEFYETQKKSNAGLYRFDFCGKIKHGNLSEFFYTIQNYFNTKYIIFEFKNYANEITQKEIYTTEKYLYEKALRKVAIIISRKGTNENAKKAARGSLREFGKLIICLSDEDLNKLIDMKNNKKDNLNHYKVKEGLK